MLTETSPSFRVTAEPSAARRPNMPVAGHYEVRDLVLNELEHRFRNVLAVVDAIMRQTLRGTDASAALVATLSLRIAALASANDLIRTEPEDASSIGAVVTAALAPFADKSEQITGGGPDIRLEAGFAVALTMVLHELATNSLKHGALSAEGGQVSAEWRVAGPAEGDLGFRWVESGGPEVRAPRREGFGLTMIRRALAPYVQEAPDFQYPPQGVVFRFEADALSDRAAPGRSRPLTTGSFSADHQDEH